MFRCVTWDSDDVYIVIAYTRIACWVFPNETQIGALDNAQATHGLHVRLAVFDANVGAAHERARYHAVRASGQLVQRDLGNQHHLTAF